MSIVDTMPFMLASSCVVFLCINRRGEKAESCLSALPVVEEDLDVFYDILNRFFPGSVVAVMDKLLLERSPETLHRCFVVTVSLSAHRCFHVKLPEQILVLIGAILTSTVRIMNKAMIFYANL